MGLINLPQIKQITGHRGLSGACGSRFPGWSRQRVVFLLIAARAPHRHRSLIGFAAWSSLVHGIVMLAQALRDPMEHANMYGDIPALILIGGVLLFLNRTPTKAVAD